MGTNLGQFNTLQCHNCGLKRVDQNSKDFYSHHIVAQNNKVKDLLKLLINFKQRWENQSRICKQRWFHKCLKRLQFHYFPMKNQIIFQDFCIASIGFGLDVQMLLILCGFSEWDHFNVHWIYCPLLKNGIVFIRCDQNPAFQNWAEHILAVVIRLFTT